MTPKTGIVELTKAQIIALLIPEEANPLALSNAREKLWSVLHVLEFGTTAK